MKNKFTSKILKELVEYASKHRITPLRFKKADVRIIMSGRYKGLKTIKKNAKPDGRGRQEFYVWFGRIQNRN